MIRPGLGRSLSLAVALFVVYVIAAKLGLRLAFLHASATPVWAPTGIALAALLLFGYRLWPAIMLGAFVINLTTEGSWSTSLGIAIGNTLEALFGTYLVNRFARGAGAFERAEDTFKFVGLAGVVATAVSATVGVTSLALGGYAAWSAYREIWLTWWLGDAAGGIIVTPLLLLWVAQPRLRWRGRRLVELALLLASVILTGEVVFAGAVALPISQYPLTFLCLPALVWAAFRFGPRETVTAIAVLSAIAIAGTLRGAGPFGGYASNESLVMLQGFMATMAMVMVPMAAVVSDWRHAAQAIERSEQLSRQLADSVPVMVWMSSPDGLRTYFNRAWLGFAGRTTEEERGHGWTERVHPDDVDGCTRAYTSAFAAREPFALEYRLRRADGEYRWISDHGVPREARDGAFDGYTGGCLDIDDRKRAERRMRAQHAVARVVAEAGSLTDAAPRILATVATSLGWDVAAAWWVDRGDNVIRCGEVWQSPSIAVPEFAAATRAAVFPPGVGLPGRVWQQAQAVCILDLLADENFPRAAVAERAGLRAGFAFPIVVGGQCLGVIEFFSRQHERPEPGLLDLLTSIGTQLGHFAERRRTETAARESESRHAAMVHASLDAIVTMDHRGQITEFNPAAESMFGWRREDVVGRAMAEVIIPLALRARHREGLARYLATGEGPVLGRRIELTALRANGDEFPVELAITRIPSEGPPSFTGYVRDITDRRRAEEQRTQLLLRAQQARAEAEAASRLKDEFLATLSHELRTPLNAIVGWSRMLLAKQIDAAATERAIAIIERNARAQAQIVDDLLDVSRIITGRLRLDLRPVDLVLLIEQSLDVVRPAAAAKRLALHAELEPDLPPVSGDPQRLQQILWNLLSNAVKFTPEGGRVDVRLARGGDGATISVLDSGQGISPEFMPYIFDRFRQADSATTRSHGGLGLGLAIVRHLVELHGGTVQAANRSDGNGAVFTVTLPIRAVASGRDLPPGPDDEAPTPLRSAEMPRLDGVRVLAVDDEADALELVSAILALRGAEVTAAPSGDDALAAIGVVRPDVLVCDIGMPGQDGYTLMRAVRALADRAQAGVPAVALTAYARREDRARARQAGFDAYLAKPVDPVTLCETVLEVSRRRRPDV